MTEPSPPTQAALGDVLAGVIRNDIRENVQPDATGVIAPLVFQPPGGFSAWQRVRLTNYTPYVFQVIGIPGGGLGDPPQILAPFQQNVWNYTASRGQISLVAAQDNSPLAVPPLRFGFSVGPQAGTLVPWYVTIEWTDTPELFFGYYPTPLPGIAITVEAISAAPAPTVKVGTTPLGIAFNTGGTKAYVTNNGDNTLTVIDVPTRTVQATVNTDGGPRGVAYDSVNNKIYVACTTGKVDIIDAGTLVLTGSVNVAGAYDVAVDQSSSKKYVSQGAGANDVVVLNAADVLSATIAVGTTPQGIDVNSTTNRAYVCNFGDNTVTVIDTTLDVTVGAPIAVGNGPTDLAVDSGNNRIYVANKTANTVTHINGATGLVVGGPIAVGNSPVAVAIEPLTRANVANNASNSVSVIDQGTDTVVGTLSPGVGPLDMAMQPGTGFLWVTLTAGVVVILTDL